MEHEKIFSLLESLKQLRVEVLEECAAELCSIKKTLQGYIQDLDKEEVLFRSQETAQAWDQVMHKISTVGSYDTVVFENPLIHAVIRNMGGWVYLCGLTRRALLLHAREFEIHYAQYKRCPPICCPTELKGRLT